jgi:ABC-type proline/glycine betaine transport system ATPase subunit
MRITIACRNGASNPGESVVEPAHDVVGVADHAMVLQGGRVVRDGPPERLVEDPADLHFATPAERAGP